MKTTLCLTCEFGLVREYDCEDDDCKERYFNNKCLLGDDYVGIITMCNRCEKENTKVTYHDPDFDEYENKQSKEVEEDAKIDICSACGTGLRIEKGKKTTRV